MGLAASQARFLGITARKNSCELRSMQIAQEKLSITNKLTQISEDYQKSLDATRLVWDSEYITDGSIYDVSYDLLMQPSILNGYSPQLLTNNKNQVVLDSQYANALKTIGNAGYKLDATGEQVNASFEDFKTGGASRTKTNFINFLNALNKGGILSKNNLDTMITALNSSNGDRFYNAYNGLGGYTTNKFATESMNLATLKRYITKLTDPGSDYMNELRKNYGTSYNDDGSKKITKDADGSEHIEIDTAYDKAIKLGELLDFNGILVEKTDEDIKDSSGNVIRTGTGEKYKGIQGFEYVDKDGNSQSGSFEDAITKQKDSQLTLSDSDFDFTDLMNKEITLSSDDAEQMAEGMAKFLDSLYAIMGNFFARLIKILWIRII